MNKTNYLGTMSKSSYAAPECEILEIRSEGILCGSSSADTITLGGELDGYEQIF